MTYWLAHVTHLNAYNFILQLYLSKTRNKKVNVFYLVLETFDIAENKVFIPPNEVGKSLPCEYCPELLGRGAVLFQLQAS